MELDANQFEIRALELAWRSCRAGTVGVGALLVDADGTVMAEGNNAIFAAADAGPLSGSRVAHAEMNVFAQIPGDMRPRNATLYTSLEPCSMCAGAIVNHGIKAVRILADDPLMSDLDAMGDRNEWIRERWAPRTYNQDLTVRRLAELFAGYHYFARLDPDHPYVRAIESTKPEIATWMTDLVSTGVFANLMSQDVEFEDVLNAVL